MFVIPSDRWVARWLAVCVSNASTRSCSASAGMYGLWYLPSTVTKEIETVCDVHSPSDRLFVYRFSFNLDYLAVYVSNASTRSCSASAGMSGLWYLPSTVTKEIETV